MDIAMKNIMFDLANGVEMFDEDRVISPAEANEKIRAYCLNELGLDKNASDKKIKRALESEAGKKLFAIIEELVDVKISTGFKENEFFNEFVESRNLADGDENEFWIDKDVILKVGKVSGSHHDIITQRLAEGSPLVVPTSYYAVKVGSDIRLFLTGRRNWTDFIDAVATAFVKKIQAEFYTEVMDAHYGEAAPSQFNKTGALSTTTKDVFDQLIEDVQTANDNAPVVIMGTKTALKKITALADVNWADESTKKAYNEMGRLGWYEGTALIEIPQRFADNDLATKLVDPTKLIIMPQVDNKFVKFVDYGETIVEKSDIADYMDDMQTYEVQRRMGIATVLSRVFGTWDLDTSKP